MSPVLARKVLAIHRWASVIVSVNFIVLAVTGLVLVFHDEIDVAMGITPDAVEGSGETELISIAQALQIAQDANPELHPIFASRREEFPHAMLFGFAEAAESARATRMLAVDRIEGKVLPEVDIDGSFTFFMLRLHAELLAGPPGRLVLGVIGLAILVALLTGIIAYGPTMKRFLFGLLRRGKSRRVFLADFHKLLGAATFAWQLLVAFTGVLLCLAVVLFQGFARHEIKALAVPYADEPPVTDMSTVDEVAANVDLLEPGREWRSILFPGTALATKRHYTFLTEGGEGLESHMMGLVVADAVDTAQVKALELPLYLQAILISEPLHFGDYGGLPLKLLWTVFTVISLALSVTGLWVFCIGRFKKRRPTMAAAPLTTGSNKETATP